MGLMLLGGVKKTRIDGTLLEMAVSCHGGTPSHPFIDGFSLTKTIHFEVSPFMEPPNGPNLTSLCLYTHAGNTIFSKR
jgi:hypothetical protein